MWKEKGPMTQTKSATDAIKMGTAMRAVAVGAFALGAVAIGAIAVGAIWNDSTPQEINGLSVIRYPQGR
jgi:hypothetical protein